MELKPEDIIISMFRADNSGGGFVYRPETGVRIHHKPTGITVEESGDRSAHRNKVNAFARLEELVKHVEPKLPEVVLYDLWRHGRWIGMVQGETPAKAREFGENSIGKSCMDECVITPYMGLGTSDETYKALMGKDPITD